MFNGTTRGGVFVALTVPSAATVAVATVLLARSKGLEDVQGHGQERTA